MKRHIPMLVAGLACAALAAAGCSSDDGVTGANAAATTAQSSTVPTFDEIDAALSLDAADETVVKEALTEVQQTDGAGKAGPPRAWHREMKFVAAVAPSLDNDQLAKLVDMITDRREERREQRMERMQARHHEHGEFHGDRAKHRAARQERRIDGAPARAERHAAWLDAVLGLSGGQLAQVKTALGTLTQAQTSVHEAIRSGDVSRNDAHEKIRAAHDAFRQSLTSILTAEQKTRLEILEPLLPGARHRRA
ncbi:MAG TPA: hypothetical protein VF247_12715 [Candidatus Krumholzibacteria bacterium]